MISILLKGTVKLFRHAQDFADNKHMHKKERVHTRSAVVSGAVHQQPGCPVAFVGLLEAQGFSSPSGFKTPTTSLLTLGCCGIRHALRDQFAGSGVSSSY